MTSDRESISANWHLRTPDGKIFGPVARPVLDRWCAEGRIDDDCDLRKDDEPWQTATAVYAELLRSAESENNPFAQEKVSLSTMNSSQLVLAHRGGLILGLGIAGLLVTCPIMSLLAWIMGSADLRKMRSGQMDLNGYQITQVGRIFGMVLSLLWLVVLVAVTLIYFLI